MWTSPGRFGSLLLADHTPHRINEGSEASTSRKSSSPRGCITAWPRTGRKRLSAYLHVSTGACAHHQTRMDIEYTTVRASFSSHCLVVVCSYKPLRKRGQGASSKLQNSKSKDTLAWALGPGLIFRRSFNGLRRGGDGMALSSRSHQPLTKA